MTVRGYLRRTPWEALPEAVNYCIVSSVYNGKYFEWKIQGKDHTAIAFCYSTRKHNIFTDFSENNSSLKVIFILTILSCSFIRIRVNRSKIGLCMSIFFVLSCS